MSRITDLKETSDVDSGLDALQANQAFRGPVDPPDSHDANEHLALIYGTKEEQFEAVVPFISQGIERGERCMYIAHENDRDDVIAALRSADFDVGGALESDRLTIHTARDTYFRDGSFDPDGMVSFLEETIDEALDEYAGFRVTGETTWLLDDGPPIADVFEYENKVNTLLADVDCIGLCQYNREKLPPEVIHRVIKTHPHIIADDTISRNNYYTPPEEDDDPEELIDVDQVIGTLQDHTETQIALEERKQFLRRLYDISADSDRPFEEKVEAMLELGCEFFDLEIGALTRLPTHDSDFEITAIVGPVPPDFDGAGQVQPEPNCFCHHTMNRDTPVGTTDVRNVGWDHDKLYDEYGLTAYVGVKVDVRSSPYGTLWFGDTAPREEPFTDAEYRILELMGQWVSYEIERKQRKRRLKDRKETLKRLNRINELVQELVQVLVEEPTRTAVEQTVCDRLAASDFYRAAWIGDRPVSSTGTTPSAFAGLPEERLSAITDATDGDHPGGLGELAVESREVQILQRVADGADDNAYREQLRASGVGSALAAPIQYEDSCYGVLVVCAGETDAFDARQRALFDEFGKTLGFAFTAAERKRALVSDGAVELEVCVRAPDHFLFHTSADTDASFSLAGLLPHDDGSYFMYVTVTGVSAETVLERAARDETVEHARRIDDRDQGPLLELVVTNPSVVDTFAEYGATVIDASVSNGDGTFVVDLPQSADVRSVIEAVRTTVAHAEVVAKRTADRPVRTLRDAGTAVTDRLTDHQRKVLRAAYHAGYFDRPRSSTGDEIAATLDISSSTFHQHLRVGLRKLLTNVFGTTSGRSPHEES